MKTRCSHIGLALAATLATARLLCAEPAIENPAVMPEAMVSIALPDLHGFLDNVGVVAAKASPMMNGMMLKSMIGMQVADPVLAGIAPGKGLAIVAMDTTNIFAVIEVAEAQAGNYAKAAANKGLQARYENGLLLLATGTNQLSQAAQHAAKAQLLLARRSPTLRIASRPAAIVERNHAAIQGLLQMMPAMMGAGMAEAPGANPAAISGTLKILQGELGMLLSLASQCETDEIVVDPANGSIRISETCVPKAGTSLATLFAAPRTAQPNPRIQSGLLGGGMIAFDFTLGNPEALAAFVDREVRRLLPDLQITEEQAAPALASMAKWMKSYRGAGCETVDFDAEQGLAINYLFEVANEAAFLEMLKSMENDMAPMLDMYRGMGLPMSISVKMDAREYKGVKVHQMAIDMATTNLPPEEAQPIEALKLDHLVYEMAVVDGVMAGGTRIEAVIDRLTDSSAAPAPIKARSVYPEGGFYYMDYDVGRYLALAASLVPGEEGQSLKQVSALLQSADPITSAGFKADGRAMWSVNIPGDLVAQIGQAAMMIQMQQMQKQQLQQAVPPPALSAPAAR